MDHAFVLGLPPNVGPVGAGGARARHELPVERVPAKNLRGEDRGRAALLDDARDRRGIEVCSAASGLMITKPSPAAGGAEEIYVVSSHRRIRSQGVLGSGADCRTVLVVSGHRR